MSVLLIKAVWQLKIMLSLSRKYRPLKKSAREKSPNFRSTDLPNHLESWNKILGRWWTPQGEDMSQKLRCLTPYNSRNRETFPRTLWTRVHPKINESKAKSGVWGVKIIHKEAQGTHPWSPQRNPERNTLKSTNREMNKDLKKRLRKSPKTENCRDTIKPRGTTLNHLYIPKRFIQGLAFRPIILPSH
jgi:hypothetical protein